MQNELVVVAPVLLSKHCSHCSAMLSGDMLSQHLCSQCGLPQPIHENEDFFTALGVPRRFEQDRADLERRFYQISRLMHPDRFTIAHAKVKELSLQRMSLLNGAYQTLKDPNLLTEYLLEREGIKNTKSAVPIEVAESWFEIQELILEDHEQANQKLQDFEGKLERLIKESEKKIEAMEIKYDLQPLRQTLEEISHELQNLNYLKSMTRDVDRIKKNGNI